MITQTQYKKVESFWLGKRVRLLAPIETNGGTRYPAGTLATIVRKFQGFELQGEPCKCCGVSLRMKKVIPMLLELIP